MYNLKAVFVLLDNSNFSLSSLCKEGCQHEVCCILSAVCCEDQEHTDNTKSALFRNDVLASV